MSKIEKLVRPHIKSLHPYSSARDDFTGDVGVFLNANENPYGDFNRYPDPYQRKLKKTIGSLKNVDVDNIFLGNGSDEIIDLLFRIFCRPETDKAMIFEPTFGMYKTLTWVNNVELLEMDLNENFQINLNDIKSILDNPKLKIIFICSPNNPTGNIINPDTVEFILENFGGITVIDEAYIEFSSTESWISAIEKRRNLIVLQTLSKAHAMAGLRIGMAFADSTVIQYLNNIKPPYNISSANQQLALDTLQNNNQKQIGLILSEKERVIEALSDNAMIEKIYPSDANFILVKVKNAENIYEQLIQQNIVVRNRHKQIKGSLRITIGTPKQNDCLITAFKNL